MATVVARQNGSPRVCIAADPVAIWLDNQLLHSGLSCGRSFQHIGTSIPAQTSLRWPFRECSEAVTRICLALDWKSGYVRQCPRVATTVTSSSPTPSGLTRPLRRFFLPVPRFLAREKDSREGADLSPYGNEPH